ARPDVDRGATLCAALKQMEFPSKGAAFRNIEDITSGSFAYRLRGNLLYFATPEKGVDKTFPGDPPPQRVGHDRTAWRRKLPRRPIARAQLFRYGATTGGDRAAIAGAGPVDAAFAAASGPEGGREVPETKRGRPAHPFLRLRKVSLSSNVA